MGNNYIVIASNGIGGAERRFFDIFLGLIDEGKIVFLIIPSFIKKKLFDVLPSKYSKFVITININSDSLLYFYYKLYFDVILKSPKYSHFHYPLNPPFFLHYLSSSTYSISFCHSSLTPNISFSSGGLTMQRLAAAGATKIDILNLKVLNKFTSLNPSFKNKCSLTPGGTYIRKKAPINFTLMKKNFSFVSRLVDGKGIFEFFRLIEIIHSYAKHNLNTIIPFRIYGVGGLSDLVSSHCHKYKNKGIDIEYCGFRQPEQIFPFSSCVFSLQEATNYPSRVIAESLLYGCNVVAYDSGDTRNFGEIEGLFYYKNDFELMQSVIAILNNKFSTALISESAQSIFSSKKYLDYFYSILNSRVK